MCEITYRVGQVKQNVNSSNLLVKSVFLGFPHKVKPGFWSMVKSPHKMEFDLKKNKDQLRELYNNLKENSLTNHFRWFYVGKQPNYVWTTK